MKTKKIFLAILVFSFAFITCKKENIKEEEKSDYPIEIEVTKLDIGQSSCWENLEFDTIHIINSKDELYHYLPCKDDLNIDFSKYSLLVFNVKNCNADSYINELSLQQISVSKYLFTADIIPSTTANAAPLIVSVLVPKIAGTDSIDLIINNNSLYPVNIPITDFSLSEGCYMNNFLSDTIYLINLQEEISEHLLCLANILIPNPIIDFDKYSLLYVKGYAINGIQNITKTLQQVSDNEYVFDINITLGETMEAPQWSVLIKVSKIDENKIVGLNINQHH